MFVKENPDGKKKKKGIHPDVFCKIGVRKNFAKFTGKHLFVGDSLLIILKACNFIKKEGLKNVFSSEFCDFFRNTFFIEHLRWLLLN